MSGQLPIDRRRAAEHAPRVLEDQKQAASELAAEGRASDRSATLLDRAREAAAVARERAEQEGQGAEKKEGDERG